MDKLPETTGNLDVALDAFAKGYAVVVIKPGTKVPDEKWSRWEGEAMTEESIYERWEGTNNGVALLCGDRLLVADVETPDMLDFVIEKCGQTPAICQTPGGGFHLHYRLRGNVELARQIKLKGKPIDLLTKNSLSIIPNSVGMNGMPYCWIGAGLPPRNELPFARIGWTRTRRQPGKIYSNMPTMSDNLGGIDGNMSGIQNGLVNNMARPFINDAIKDIRSYIRRIPSKQGENGSRGLMRVCYLLAERFPYLDALAELLDWNRVTPEPPWCDAELEHALQNAFRRKLKEVIR